MKRRMIAFLFAMPLWLTGAPEEGMWIPMLLEKQVIGRMQDMGLKLSAEDIYSVNTSSLKDGIVMFGGGCTAEIVSEQGLILTNHHCGLGAIQRLSSLDRDYLANGFWAQSINEEIPSPGTTVTLLVRMEDVTSKVLEGVDETMNQLQRIQIIRKNAAEIEKQAAEGSRYEAKIRSFFYGNQYYLFVNQVFRDIRLVGAPPTSIGKFGGDTDNWMWPRHTGDFSVFRIYADKDNQPAAYASSNVPYKPRHFFPISLKGYKKHDFTFVFGYPGTTREYLPARGVDLVVNQENPVRIRLRGIRLDIIHSAMESDRLTGIQYASKAAGIANYWKKMIGESRGIRRIGAIEKKQELETRFNEWVAEKPDERVRYSTLSRSWEQAYNKLIPSYISGVYINEAGQSIEIVRFAAGFRSLVTMTGSDEATNTKRDEERQKLIKASREFFKNYNTGIDRKVMAKMLEEMATKMSAEFRPQVMDEITGAYGSDFSAYAEKVFSTSVFSDSLKVFTVLNKWSSGTTRQLLKDPVYRLMNSIYETVDTKITPVTSVLMTEIDSLQRIYMTGLMAMESDRIFYPDANSTLRVAFGKVDDYSPADAVNYFHYTTLDGIMEKEDPSVSDYRVDEKLKLLYRDKNFGPYADADGKMHVAFTASNHTTGGNSGSPVLNADGELIGINFDRNWEGTLSDLMYDPSQCRNISLDIRYCLFIIDRYAGCTRLIDEMKITGR